MRPRFSTLLSALSLFAVLAFGWSFVTGIENPLHSAAITEEPTSPAPPPDLVQGVRIEVLNGSGVPGVARAATRRLRDWGFDVVYIGNARTFDHEETQVLLRAGDLAAAEAVAQALAAGTPVSAPDSSLALEVTVVLGKDFVPPPRR